MICLRYKNNLFADTNRFPKWVALVIRELAENKLLNQVAVVRIQPLPFIINQTCCGEAFRNYFPLGLVFNFILFILGGGVLSLRDLTLKMKSCSELAIQN